MADETIMQNSFAILWKLLWLKFVYTKGQLNSQIECI